MEYLCYSGKSDFLFKNIKIPLDYFYKILKGYFEDSEIDAYEKKLLNGISKVSISPYMEHIFAELKDFAQYRGGLGYLFLESKILELLSVYLSEVLELSILASNYIGISKSDRDAIVEAKRIIDSQVATLVGYSKPSNFAAAFKKKYGVIPKNYKAENTIG